MKVKPTSIVFTLMLAAMAALPPLSIDIYLSALSVIGKSLGSTATAAGYTVSVFLLSTALSQLVFGPLSDRYGRRPIGMFGSTLFTIGALGCTLAHSMPTMLLSRLLQGVGAGSVLVLAFAIVRDSFSGPEAAVRYSYVNATMCFVPAVAPVVGSLLFKVAGWRPIFGVCAVVGALLTAVFAFWFEESLAEENRTRFSPVALARNYFRVITHRTAFGYILLSAMAFGAMLVYVTGSSFVFVDLIGMKRTNYASMLFVTSFAMVFGSFSSGALNKRGVSYKKILTASLSLTVTATVILLALSFTPLFAVATAMPLIFMTTFSVGSIAPNAAHGVLTPMPDIAGTASALLGSMRMLTGALSSACVSFAASLVKPSPVPMASVMVLFNSLALISYVTMIVMAPKQSSGDLKAPVRSGEKLGDSTPSEECATAK